MNMTRARAIADLCWIDSRTRRLPKDPALVEVFAERLMKLANAAEALYMAGRWTLEDDRIDTTDLEQIKLWEDLRDALGLQAGSCPVWPEEESRVIGEHVSSDALTFPESGS